MAGDPISQWFAAQGISPLAGGALLGAALTYLLLRARKSPKTHLEAPSVPAQRTAVAVSGDLKARALDHVRRKNKIEAIKLVREETGLGLKEAKDQVEAWEREGG